MLNRGWCGTVLTGVFLSLMAHVASAQESQAPSEELQDLKRRLEVLEKEKAERDAKSNAPPSVLLMDPAEDKWYDRVKVGGGVRATFRSQTHSAPNGGSASTDFALESGRLYTGGKITDWLSATLNAEFTAGGASVLDAIAQFKVAEEFNVFVGRMLPATDRSNSDGPYYLATWDFPFLSDGFNSTGKTGDRDDGITLWGDVGKFKYWVGVYEGSDRGGLVPADVHDGPLYAARIQYDFMDAENGYYLTSTYYGDKKILAVGLVANYQSHASGPVTDAVGYGNVALDFLWEQKLDFLADGVATVEAAYYYYGRHGYTAPAGSIDVGPGNGFLFLVAYLIPGKVGWGQFQPHIRYQGFDEIDAGTVKNPTPSNVARWDFGVNYVMAGHNARISMVYSHTDFSGPTKTGLFTLGTQFQF